VFSDIERLPALQTAVQQKKKSVLHMDNSPIHKSRAVTEKIASLRLALAPTTVLAGFGTV
jgi:transposase